MAQVAPTQIVRSSVAHPGGLLPGYDELHDIQGVLQGRDRWVHMRSKA